MTLSKAQPRSELHNLSNWFCRTMEKKNNNIYITHLSFVQQLLVCDMCTHKRVLVVDTGNFLFILLLMVTHLSSVYTIGCDKCLIKL